MYAQSGGETQAISPFDSMMNLFTQISNLANAAESDLRDTLFSLVGNAKVADEDKAVTEGGSPPHSIGAFPYMHNAQLQLLARVKTLVLLAQNLNKLTAHGAWENAVAEPAVPGRTPWKEPRS